MLASDDLPSLKRRVEKIREKKNEATGAKKRILGQIQKEFEVESIKEAKKLYTKLLSKVHEKAERDIRDKNKLEMKYKDKLIQLEDL